MNMNWKKTAVILADTVLAVYLVLAITAFNRPDGQSDVCQEVRIDIGEAPVKGFLDANIIRSQLQRDKLYPLGDLMNDVDVRRIEEGLLKNPFVETAECYKTQTGHVCIRLTQRVPVIRIKSSNGEDYYIDSQGVVMTDTHYASDIAVATGDIQRPYAKRVLAPLGSLLLSEPLWRSQVEQLNVLHDGSIELVPRVGDHIVYLGPPVHLQRKLSRLEKFYRYGLSQAGWNKYSYISLEFDNQIICKKRRR